MAKPPIVLVHGAWHDSQCWRKIVPLLEAAGRRTVALDLPGRAGDPRPHAKITLDDFVDHVCAALDDVGAPAILVGHSFGGLTITMAAERRPDQIAALIYVTGILPQNGQSTWDIISADTRSRAPDGVVPSGDKTSTTMRADSLGPTFYHDCDPADIALAREQVVPEVFSISLARVATTPARFGRVRKIYIECTDDRAITLDAQRRMTAATPCDRIITMTTAHSPFLAAPDELAAHLLGV